MNNETLDKANNLRNAIAIAEGDMAKLEKAVITYDERYIFNVKVDKVLRDTIYTLIKANKEAELKRLKEEFERL